ncbi:MAG: insulinase family protein [Bacteroidales bacterium]|nr:insulinase family protein [Bacteroidales bacterium]
MKRHIILGFVLAFIGCTAMAQIGIGNDKPAKQTNLSAQVPLDKKVRYGKLENGFTYYIRANKKPENRIQFRLVSNAGSILEREDQRGLAHFCEHMAFNGIKGYPHNEMIKKLQDHGVAFGSHVNAYTGFDQTVYFVNIPSDDPEMVQMGIDILDGWAGNILFDQAEIESERGVIHEEWRGRLGAGDRMLRKLLPLCYAGSLYAERLPIGLESVIMNFERQSIVDFFNDWYRPDLQAIVIVGDIPDINAMEQQVRQVFGAHPKAVNPKERKAYTVPDNVEPIIAIATDKEATSTSIEFSWKHPAAHEGTVGDYRQSLVRWLIVMMINDRMNELCEKNSSPMIGAGAGYGSSMARAIDNFRVAAAPKENRIEASATELLRIMKQIDDHGFLQTELDRQKEELLALYTKMAKEENKTESDDLADEYTQHFLTGSPAPGIRQEWRYAKEFIPGITLEECNQTVSEWITDNNLVVQLTAPERDDLAIPTEQTLLNIVRSSKSVETEPWVDNFEDKPLFSDNVPAATAKITGTNNVLGYTEYTCPNGVRFVVKKTDLKADEILIESYSHGGTSLYGDAEAYTAQNATSFVVAGGVGDFSRTQLDKRLKGKNVSIVPQIGKNYQGFSGDCSPDDLETALQLINLYYTAPRKDQESYERIVDATVNQIKFIAENPQVAFSKKYYETAYPNDHRTVLIATEEQVRSLSLDRMFDIYRERFADASSQIFFFVGNVDDKDIDLIARYLNNLPTNGKQRSEKYIDRSSDFAKGVVHAEAVKGMERQGMLIINGEMKVDASELTPETRVALDAFGEALQITVTEIIREKNGDAYSPSASVDYALLPSGKVEWMFYIGCDPDKAKKIEKDCIKIMKNYLRKGPDAATLDMVKKQMIVDRGNSRQENYFWMSQIYYSYNLGESRDYIERYNEMVQGVSAKQIKQLAKRYIDLKNYVVVTLRPESLEGNAQ